MAQWIEVNSNFIKPRELKLIVDTLQAGKVIVIPSDSGYALLCRLGDKGASQKIRTIRQLEKDHPFTIVCSDLTHLGQYAKVDNTQFRLLKTLFPGAFTCILPASKDAPRLVQHEKRKTIGIRVPNHLQ
ncbi:L-threonylcarbamoyladenylate synthase [Suttonella ornithocola]|uniref:Translation factor (SUA5) n=1 Tax=Suttonella ornithocola TaxID=279832 RepID=A0A380N1G2_9GAMM|nr:Sua5/YciO/YrdC/YwlC family protein [Suttonella ornithocola]SUO97741.1 Putative translation factor (SUA5) [Suttonella ornithocola]